MEVSTDIKENIVLNYLISLGGKLNNDSNGDKVISEFSSLKEELFSLQSGVGVRYLVDKSILELNGKDSLDFLHRISTNSVKELNKGQLVRTIITTEKARIIGSVIIGNFDNYNLMFCNSYNKKKIESWINRYIIADDVSLIDTENKYSLLELSGPQSNSFITLITGNGISDIESNTLKVVHTEGMMFFVLKIKGLNGDDKYWLLSDETNCQKLIEFMIDNKGPFDFNLVGQKAYDLFRILNGIPTAPNEFNDTYNPLEAGLLEYIDFKKGCYIGQEIIARLDTYKKVKRQIKGIIYNFKINSQLPLSLVDKEGNDAGELTSIEYYEEKNNYYGLAMIRNSFLSNPTELFVKDDNDEIKEISFADIPIRI